METRAFRFAPNSTFSRFLEELSRHKVWIIKQCHFPPQKIYCFGWRTRDKTLKILWKANIKFDPAFILRVSNVCLFQRIPYMASELSLDKYLTHILAEKKEKNS